MKGTVNIKLKKILALFKRTGLPLLLVFTPLIIHYLSTYFSVLNLGFNLNNFNTIREIYLIFLSIYLGYVFIEFLNIFSTPNIQWEVYNSTYNISLRIKNVGDIFNKMFKQNSLNNLFAIIEVEGKVYFGRWMTNPEPTAVMPDQGRLVEVPDFSKISMNRKVQIFPNIFDHLIICWKKPNTSPTEYYFVDEFKYIIPQRYDPANKLNLPNILKVILYNESDTYEFEVNLNL